MADRFGNEQRLDSPGYAAFDITKHDTNALTEVTRAIYVGTGGDIVLRAIGSAADVTLKGVPQGALVPLRVSHVRSTGTTAADLVGFV